MTENHSALSLRCISQYSERILERRSVALERLRKSGLADTDDKTTHLFKHKLSAP
jgi:hypothetical protein